MNLDRWDELQSWGVSELIERIIELEQKEERIKNCLKSHFHTESLYINVKQMWKEWDSEYPEDKDNLQLLEQVKEALKALSTTVWD